jgi:Holliday junction resolvase
MGKGAKRERELQSLYERAGFETYRPATVRFGENDVFGLFDVLALRPGEVMHCTQVKSNRAAGITDWMDSVLRFQTVSGIQCRFAVCHDREGWRLAEPRVGAYEWVYDGRDNDRAMGDGLVEHLEP